MTEGPDQRSGWNGIGTGYAVAGTLLAGVLVYSGIGYLLDRWLGTQKVFLAVGMIGGAVLGTYLVYLKYGKGKSAH